MKCDEIRRWLSDVGEKMDQYEVCMSPHRRGVGVDHAVKIDKLLKAPFTDRNGNFNYREWVKVLRINDEEETKQASSM